MCKQRDASLIQRAVAVLRKLESDSVLQDTVLHLIVSHLCSNPDLLAQPDLCQTVLAQFLLVRVAFPQTLALMLFSCLLQPHASKENLFRHIVRLLWWTHHRVAPATLTKALSKLGASTSVSVADDFAWKHLFLLSAF